MTEILDMQQGPEPWHFEEYRLLCVYTGVTAAALAAVAFQDSAPVEKSQKKALKKIPPNGVTFRTF